MVEEAGGSVVELPGDPPGLAVASTPELAATLAGIAGRCKELKRGAEADR